MIVMKNLVEVKERIGKLEQLIFTIDMIDRWTQKDAQLFDKYNKELKELKDLLINEIVK